MATKKNKSKKQKQPRRTFTEEFRADVVRLCRSGGDSVAEVFRRLDLTTSVVHGWVKRADADPPVSGVASVLTDSENQELQRLRREVKVLKVEREILKKAALSSDRGSPYGSDDDIKRLEAVGMLPSMSRKGDCWDNAVAESFFSTLEFECRGLHQFVDFDDADNIVGDYIDAFYNPERLHSTIGYCSPIEFEISSALSQMTA